MIFRRGFTNSGTLAMPPLGADAAWVAYLTGKGYAITSNTAIKVAAVIRCVDVVAKTMASLPLNLYAKTSSGSVKAGGHPLYKLLNRLPNPETTAYEFWHMYVFNLMLTSGAYAKIVRDQSGIIRQLWNIPTARVRPGRNTINGEAYVDVLLENAQYERLRDGEFMYTPGLRFTDAGQAEDPLRIASDVLGLTMALNGYAKDFFENGSNLGGFVENPGQLNDKSYARFHESWDDAYAGVKNQHKIAFLEGGMKFNQLDQNPTDAQALESRKFAVIEICRLFGIPPHKVFSLDNATFSNIEHLNIEYVQETINPMSVRNEQTIYKDLLTTREQDIYYAKFNTNALLRGDTATRTAYYSVMRQNGVMNANMILALEDENAIPAAEGGDAFLVNGNMISLKSAMENLPKSLQKNGGQ